MIDQRIDTKVAAVEPVGGSPGGMRRFAMLALVGLVTVVVLVVAYLMQRPLATDVATASSPQQGPDVVGIGAPAPQFAAVTTDGEQIALEQFRGHPVWLSFGATWCAGCRAEAPDMKAAAARHKGDGLVVIAVYLSEDAGTVKSYADLLGADYLHVPDPQKRVAALYPSAGVPTHYFVDADGVIRDVRVGILTPAQMDAEVALLGS